jgi:SAM-dependent methyltransferase
MKSLTGIISTVALMEFSTAFVLTSKVKPIMTRLHEVESSYQDEFIDKQKAVSSGTENTSTESESSLTIQSYLKHQQKCFDDMSDFFNSDEATPPDVVPVLKLLVKKALVESTEGKDDKKLSILDVGCGTGALFSTYLEVADDLGIELDITGLDLSPKMIEFATENVNKLLEEEGDGKHSIACETGDFVQTILGVEICNEALTGFDHGVVNEFTSEYRGMFDAVMINACVRKKCCHANRIFYLSTLNVS